MLSREQILGADDSRRETVQVPEWGGEVVIAAMSGAARDAWEQSLVIRKGAKVEQNLANMRARLVAVCAVDADGKRLFTDDDAIALGEKSAAALERLCRVAQRLNGLTDKELEVAKGN